MLPTFVGLGVPRAGTTWLHDLLDAHPRVYVPVRRKELDFFDRNYHRGFQWYEGFFPSDEESGRYDVAGEISTGYLYDYLCAERIRAAGVDRVLVSLRHPVERAWSHYRRYLRTGDGSEPFEEWVRRSSVLDMGFYHRHLQRYLELFPRERVLILIFEEAVANVEGTKDRLSNFLGVERTGFPFSAGRQPKNQVFVPRAPAVFAALHRAGRWLRKHDHDWPVNLAKSLGIRRLFRSDRVGEPGMAPSTRRRLERLYADDMRDLESLLGRRVNAWRRTATRPAP